MNALIESELLAFLHKKKPITLQDCEDWIVLDALHEQQHSHQQQQQQQPSSSNSSATTTTMLSQRALYYSLPFIYRGDYNRCVSHINRLVARLNNSNNSSRQPNSHRQTQQQEQQEQPQASSQQQQQHTQSQQPLLTKFDLGLSATGKALLFGAFSFDVNNSRSTTTIDISREPTGHVISTEDAMSCCNFTKLPRHFLVVEKEAVARHLVSTPFLAEIDAALLCIKGFPCVASRMFVQRMIEQQQQTATTTAAKTTKFHFIGDCDPHGLAIYLTICQLNNAAQQTQPQSKNKKQQNQQQQQQDDVTTFSPTSLLLFQRISWLGLKPSYVASKSNNNTGTGRFPASVSWTVADTRCIKTVKTTLSSLVGAVQSGGKSIFASALLEEVHLMESKQMKLELEALRGADLVKMINDGL